MGLFDKLKNISVKASGDRLAKELSQKAQVNVARTPNDYMAPWPLPAPKYEVILRGDYERAVYTYDSRPFLNMRDDQQFLLELFRGEGGITSVHTGYYKDTVSSGDTLVLYEGRPIGFTSIPKDKVYQAASMGYTLKIPAICRGWLEGYSGVKEIKALTPQRVYLVEWIRGAADDRPLWNRDDYFSYNERDGSDFANLVSKPLWVFPNAKISIIPTPKGSSAKPHIGLYSSDGMQFSEVYARNGYYKDLLEFSNRFDAFDVRATRQISEDESIYYKIEIMGK